MTSTPTSAMHPPQEEAHPASPYKITMAYLERETKLAFEQEAFGMVLAGNPAAGSPKATQKSKVFTKKQWETRIHFIKHWDEGDGTTDTLKEFRKAERQGYQWVQQFEVSTNDSGISTLLRKDESNRIAVHQGMIFDIIKEAHVSSSSHLKVARTSSVLKEKYHNITEDLVKLYIKLCPICNGEQPKVKPMKGAKKPIVTLGFRDRFQVDLIDYREDPQKFDPKDPNSPTYHWLLNAKDHFTRLVYFRPLISKEPKWVAQELLHFFSFVGYPLIYHSDNGHEVHSEEVLSILREINPMCFTVAGRARKPSDQGSVERSNQTAKRAISNVVQEVRKQGIRHASWVTEYPKVMAAMNATANKGLGETSAYAAVFGMTFHEPLQTILMSNLKDATTVADRIKLLGPDYRKKMEFLGEVTDEALHEQPPKAMQGPGSKTLPGGFNLNKDLEAAVDPSDLDRKPAASPRPPTATTPPVVRQSARLKPAPSATTSKKKVSQELAQVQPSTKEESKAIKKQLRNQEDLVKTVRLLTQLDLKTAFDNVTQTRVLSDGKHAKVVFPCLGCDGCVYTAKGFRLSFFDSNYLRFNASTQRWWETDFLTTYSQLCAHEVHSKSVMLMHINYPNERVDLEMVKPVAEGITICVALANTSSAHFAAISIDLEDRLVAVYDGKSYPLRTWTPHILNMMKRLGLIDLHATDSKVLEYRSLTRSEEEDRIPTQWLVVGRVLMKQSNGYDCGPIAAMTIRSILKAEEGFEATNSSSLRKFIVHDYKRLFVKFKDILHIERLVKESTPPGHRDQFSVPSSPELPAGSTTCPCCLDVLFPIDQCKLDCGHSFHLYCILAWETSSGHISCPLCRTHYDSIEAATTGFSSQLKVPQAASLPTKHKQSEQSSLSSGLDALAAAAAEAETNRTLQDAARRRKRMISEAAGRERQSKSRRKMMEAYTRECKVTVGTLVTIRVDKRDRSQANPRGLLGVIFHVSPSTHSIKVVMEHGVLASRGKVASVSSDDYQVVHTNTPVSQALKAIRATVFQGSFDAKDHCLVSTKKAHQEDIGATVYGTSKCRCKKQPFCSKSCACRKANRPCTSACGCNGNCSSTHRIYAHRKMEEAFSSGDDEMEED